MLVKVMINWSDALESSNHKHLRQKQIHIHPAEHLGWPKVDTTLGWMPLLQLPVQHLIMANTILVKRPSRYLHVNKHSPHKADCWSRGADGVTFWFQGGKCPSMCLLNSSGVRNLGHSLNNANFILYLLNEEGHHSVCLDKSSGFRSWGFSWKEVWHFKVTGINIHFYVMISFICSDELFNTLVHPSKTCIPDQEPPGLSDVEISEYNVAQILVAR